MERARTNASGLTVELCRDTPFGMNLICTSPTDQSPIHFASLQYDPEAGKKSVTSEEGPVASRGPSERRGFGVRGCSPLATAHSLLPLNGRWLSPDPGGLKVVHLDDPQTWNMYAYVRNNPTTFTDPSGLEGNQPPPCKPGTSCPQHKADTTDAALQQKAGDPTAHGQPNLVIVVASDTTKPAEFPPGVTQRDRNYTVETKEDDSFHADTNGKHFVTMNEKQTGGNDKPRLADPNEKGRPTLQDQIHVSAPGKSFTTTQTLHIDGNRTNAPSMTGDRMGQSSLEPLSTSARQPSRLM
ncbi:MAG: hypothetical protein LAO04_15815 [Acidobacteriia bacterium]|nr:hypothetical protein [Terriglobia bacterium]